MKIRSALVIVISVVAMNAFSQDALRKKHFNLDDEVAIQGYDSVAYFTQGRAIKGDRKLGATWNGISYYFSSQGNKEEFNKHAAMYEPQYGGWCAYAMGTDGSKVNIDPETFKVVNGRLYLFYNRFFNNTLKSWNKDEPRLMKNADKNWQNIFH